MFGADHKATVDVMCITNVAVYTTPLDCSYRREDLQKQWTSLDFHAFVVLKKNKETMKSKK